MVEFVRHSKNEQLKRDWSGCFRCPLSTLRSQVVFGKGPFDAPIMLVGEAPGKDEDLGGEPFIGAAGEMLDKILHSVGLDRTKLWITNTCLCRPKSDGKRENRAPNIEEIEACRPRLISEIEIVRPQILVLCGSTPLFWAAGLEGVSKYRGRLEVTIRTPSHIVNDVFVTYHPAALFHGSEAQIKEKKWATYRDWRLIKDCLLDKQSPQDKEQRQEKNNSSPDNS